MPKVIDLPTATTMDNGDYLLMEESSGGTKKITRQNAVSKEFTFTSKIINSQATLDAAVTSGNCALYCNGTFTIGSTEIRQYTRGMAWNIPNSTDGVAIFVTSTRTLIVGFRNGGTWTFRQI